LNKTQERRKKNEPTISALEPKPTGIEPGISAIEPIRLPFPAGTSALHCDTMTGGEL
jgi:hypothetical protein